MKSLTYVGPEGWHYPTLAHDADGETVAGLIPVVGETYKIDADEAPDGNWVGSHTKAAREAPKPAEDNPSE